CSFLLSGFGSIRRKDEVNDHEARFIHSDYLYIYRSAVNVKPFWGGRYAIGLYLHLPFSWAYWFRVPIVCPNEKGCQIDGSLFLTLFMQIN
ncbi:hypothetical protein, partial [Mycobacterium tuberculosis]|uniref:hypothetical protein n=1 Tax=Mycobacterium tuberculosis TaxID=1773 RepID=UPI00254B48AF